MASAKQKQSSREQQQPTRQLQPTQQQAQQLQQPAQQQPAQQLSEQPTQPQTHSHQSTNTMAILGLIFAFVLTPLGLVFSIISLNELKKNPNQEGHGLALAGLIVSCVLMALFIFASIGALAYFGWLSPVRMIP